MLLYFRKIEGSPIIKSFKIFSQEKFTVLSKTMPAHVYNDNYENKKNCSIFYLICLPQWVSHFLYTNHSLINYSACDRKICISIYRKDWRILSLLNTNVLSRINICLYLNWKGTPAWWKCLCANESDGQWSLSYCLFCI